MNRITPRWLYFAMLITLCATAASFLLRSSYTEVLSLGTKELAYLLATGFCLKIASEYRRQPALRLAWLLLAANALVSVARHILEMSWFEKTPFVHLYRQIAITLALLLLVGGMWTMARAFLRTGLGFRIHRIDIFGVATVFALLSAILFFHEHLSEALSAPRDVQLFSQVVIAVAGASAVLLHRIILDMGGGKLAIAMRFLVGHIVGRVVLVLASEIATPNIAARPEWEFSRRLAFDATIWIFALAACYRASMLAAAVRQAPPKPEEILALSLDKQWSRI